MLWSATFFQVRIRPADTIGRYGECNRNAALSRPRSTLVRATCADETADRATRRRILVGSASTCLIRCFVGQERTPAGSAGSVAPCAPPLAFRASPASNLGRL